MSTHRTRAGTLLAAALGVAAISILASTSALRAGTGETDPSPAAEEQTGPWIEEAEPELQAKLVEAERAATEGRWDDAAIAWQEILDTAPPRLVNVRPSLPNTFTDVREAIRIRLSTLPPEGLAAYRRQSDPAAERLHVRALREKSRERLIELWRRFAITSYGGRALIVLADEALRAGSMNEAVAHLSTFAHYHPDHRAPGVEPAGVILRRAWCAARRSDTRLLAALREIAEPHLETEATFAGRQTTLGEALDAMEAIEPDPESPREWPLPGGHGSRDRRAHLEPGRLELLGWLEWEETREHSESPHRRLLTGREAVVHRGRIYVKGLERIVRLDLETGVEQRSFEDLDKMPDGDPPSPTSGARVHPSSTADGWMFAVHESEGSLPMSSLIGMDLARDGLQMWVIGGGREDDDFDGERGEPRNAWDDPFHADMRFAGSAVTSGGRIYVSGATHDRKIGAHLVCLDGRRGHRGDTIWRRLVGYGTPVGRMAGDDGGERTDPGSPAIADGVVYLSTNLGAVAAVDALSGDVLWLHRYRRSGSRRYQGAMTGGGGRWRTDFPIATGDAVFVTPADSDRLLVYAPRIDRASGQVLLGDTVRRRFPGAEITYEDLVGVDRGVLVLSGTAGEDGSPIEARKAWPSGPGDQREDVWLGDPPEDRVTGRGFLTHTHAVVPTEKGIYRFALRGDGRHEPLVLFEDVVLPEHPDGRTWRVFGNLTPAGDRVVSVTPDGVFVFRVRPEPEPGPDGSGPLDRRR